MTEILAAVKSALDQRRNESGTNAGCLELPCQIIEGDLRAIEASPHLPPDRRIVFVRRVDSVREFAEVMLTHSATELATDCDVIVPADVASAPFDLVVQTDLRGAVWTSQLTTRIGHLEHAVMSAVWTVGRYANAGDISAARNACMPALSLGTQLAGSLDRRWRFKESEGDVLRALAADCTEALLDSYLVWEVNPDYFSPTF